MCNFKQFVNKYLISIVLVFSGVSGAVSIFFGFLYEKNSALSSLLLNFGAGIITSIIFYLIVVELKWYREFQRYRGNIYNRLNNMYYIVGSIIQQGLINGYTNKINSPQIYQKDKLTKSDIELFCETLCFFSDKVPNHTKQQLENNKLIDIPVTQIENIITSFSKLESEANDLFQTYPLYLSVEITKSLLEVIENYGQLRIKCLMSPLYTRDRDLSALSDSLYSLFLWAENLQKYNNKHYRIK